MLGTYNYMALGVAGTAVVVMLLMANPQVMAAIALGPMKWVVFAAVLGLGWFAPRLFFGGSEVIAQGAYWLYCALWGALIAPMVSLYVGMGMAGIVGQAFFIAAAMFARDQPHRLHDEKGHDGLERLPVHGIDRPDRRHARQLLLHQRCRHQQDGEHGHLGRRRAALLGHHGLRNAGDQVDVHRAGVSTAMKPS